MNQSGYAAPGSAPRAPRGPCRVSPASLVIVSGLLTLGALGNACADTFIVSATADDGSGSLRQAIADANSIVGPHTIVFDIPGEGVQLIAPETELPIIECDGLTIDGYTQPGATPNTLAIGNDATIAIHIDGGIATIDGTASGLTICAPDVTVRGLSITGFTTGLDVGSVSACGSPHSADLVVIEGNFIGVLPDGRTAAPNGSGVFAQLAGGAVVGGMAPSARNVIAGNTVSQFRLINGSGIDARIVGNHIGADASGLAPPLFADVSNGIEVTSLSGLTIDFNRIAFNRNAVTVRNSTGVRIAANAIHANAALGIDLIADGLFQPDGVTPNDPDDTDTGGNELQNFPVLDSVELTEAQRLHVAGSLDRSTTGTDQEFELHFYANSACNPSGHGEGEAFLASTTLTFAADAPETFDIVLDPLAAPPPGALITATATDAVGNTSEFSACLALPVLDTIFAHGFEQIVTAAPRARRLARPPSN